MLIYEGLANAFAAEGVDTQFGLMGDGNMHWMTAMQQLPGMTTIGVRHEHCAVLMAIGYWSVTGKVGVASVTHGPGFTQVMTALTTAVRNHVPLVIFAGETSLGAPWALQGLDQAPLARACGAEYIALHSPRLMHQRVMEAFYAARTERRPIVLGVPVDLQKQAMPDLPAYRPSADFLPPPPAPAPDPAAIADLAVRLRQAKRPLLVAGRGALRAGAAQAIEELADATGALLGTSLLGKGMFDHHEFSLGIVGGYIRETSREVAADVDLVLFFGAQISRFTLDGGALFRDATVVQVDIEPNGFLEGLPTADVRVRADARLAAEALLGEIQRSGGGKAAVRTPELAQRLREGPADPTPYDIPDDTLDPRRVMEALEAVLPADYHLVSGSAHQAYWHTQMRGMPAENYHAIRAFGAIGNALPFAIGVAVARGDGRVVLVEGDGGLLMHIQELETLEREGIKLLVVCVDDGAFGAEIHKLRVDGVSDVGAVFGRPNFEGVAKAFGIGGETIRTLDQIAPAMAAFEESGTAALWDVHVSDRVLTPPMRDEVNAARARK
jgi:thiamine pyrophosphate-dependent acetolactate synthase large subunit-like protein